MSNRETIESWKWRIVRAGHTAKSFGELTGIADTQLSNYFNKKKNPGLKSFDSIEGKLKELEAKLDIA